jgi:hypothetical protein
MGHRISSPVELIAEFRQMLPSNSKTARAIDEQESFESIAMKAVDDGYIEFSHELVGFMEVCLRRNM